VILDGRTRSGKQQALNGQGTWHPPEMRNGVRRLSTIMPGCLAPKPSSRKEAPKNKSKTKVTNLPEDDDDEGECKCYSVSVSLITEH
jgi:hypothetical protein